MAHFPPHVVIKVFALLNIIGCLPCGSKFFAISPAIRKSKFPQKKKMRSQLLTSLNLDTSSFAVTNLKNKKIRKRNLRIKFQAFAQ